MKKILVVIGGLVILIAIGTYAFRGTLAWKRNQAIRGMTELISGRVENTLNNIVLLDTGSGVQKFSFSNTTPILSADRVNVSSSFLTAGAVVQAQILPEEEGSIAPPVAVQVIIIKNPPMIVMSPADNEVLHSPFTLSGLVDQSFVGLAVRLSDDYGNILANKVITLGSADANGYKPFSVSLSFSSPFNQANIQIIPIYANRQASAITENMAVFLNTARSTSLIDFFSRANSGEDCALVEPEARAVAESPDLTILAREAIDALILGPAPTLQHSENLYTNLPQNTVVNSITLQNNSILNVDFTHSVEAGGSCRAAATMAQITQTLKAIPGITAVNISVNSIPGIQP